jgi:hypothetical protein
MILALPLITYSARIHDLVLPLIADISRLLDLALPLIADSARLYDISTPSHCLQCAASCFSAPLIAYSAAS